MMLATTAPAATEKDHMNIERENIAAQARGWIGTPYRHQASLMGIGCDCLGLVRGVWRQTHGHEPERTPPYAPGWAEGGRRELLIEAANRHFVPVDMAGLLTGDLLLFRWRPHLPAKHAAIATSPGTMVHAQQGAAVCEIAISNWWRRHLAAVFRFPGMDD